jgi:hypothetical protein
MKKIYLLLLLNAFGAFIIAQSPITLSNSNMPGGGDTLRYTNVQLSSVANYTLTGTNFNWDFSNVVSTTEGVRNFKNAISTPYALFFLNLGEYGEKIADTLLGAGPLTLTKYYSFYKKQSSPSAFIADGVGLTMNNIPVPSYYSDKDELYNFPMTYPKRDSSTFRFSVTTVSLIPISYSKAGYRITEVDGWGTITTPYGTQNCLRLITTQYSKDSIKNSIFPIVIPNYVRSYQWLTTTSKIPYFEVSGTLVGSSFTPTNASYRGYDVTPGATGIVEAQNSKVEGLYPNPVKELLWLDVSLTENEKLEIYSVEGKLVTQATAGIVNKKTSLDVSSLAQGTYFLKITGGKQERSFKFVKE